MFVTACLVTGLSNPPRHDNVVNSEQSLSGSGVGKHTFSLSSLEKLMNFSSADGLFNDGGLYLSQVQRKDRSTKQSKVSTSKCLQLL